MRLGWKYLGVLASAWPLAGLSSGLKHEAFLQSPVTTTGELVREVQSDQLVQTRYADHFHLSPTELGAYLWSLRPSHTASTQVVTVFTASDDGEFTSHQEVLPKSSAVFIDIHDKPILLVATGDPIAVNSKPERPNFTNL